MNAPRTLEHVITSSAVRDGAGVSIRRISGEPRLDPFLMFDEFGSDDPDDYLAGFPSHPHRGFETVTYMLAGHMEHRDSVGNAGRLGPGDVQWMTAGRGIVHSEMPLREDGLMRGFQLWVNLPAAAKMCAPRYQEIAAARIPAVTADGVSVKVIAGSHQGTVGAVVGIATEPTYLDVGLGAGRAFEHPTAPDHTVVVYVYDGAIDIGAAPVEAGSMAVLGPGERVVVEAGSTGAGMVLLGARPIGEPVARYGPFVMNTRAEIEAAIADYRAGRLGT